MENKPELINQNTFLLLSAEKPDPGKPTTLRDFFAYVADPKDENTSIKVHLGFPLNPKPLSRLLFHL